MNYLSKFFLVSILHIVAGSAFAASEAGYSTSGNSNNQSSFTTKPGTAKSAPANSSTHGYSTSKSANNGTPVNGSGYQTSHQSGSVSHGGYTTHSNGPITNQVVSNHGYSTHSNGSVSNRVVSNGGYSTHSNGPVTNQVVSNHGYSTQGKGRTHVHTHHSGPHFSFNMGTTGFSGFFADGPEEYVVIDHYENPPSWPRWFNSAYGIALPANAVVGGQEPYSNNLNFVCRADYESAIYPGRLVDGKCHFATNGIEIAASEYQVLVSPFPLRWVASGFGHVPNKAIYGGRTANGRALYVCQANYKGINIPGRISDRGCKIGIDGREINKSHYHVLTA